MPEVAVIEAASTSDEDWAALLSASQPTAIRGLVDGWPAIKLWDGEAGLDRLAHLAGDCPVQVLDGAPGGKFYGSITNHSRKSCRFRDFLHTVRTRLYGCRESDALQEAQQLSPYLAQAPITGLAGFEHPLSGLQRDISKPSQVPALALKACNLWMNSAPAQSSTHYDPYHNLLCVVKGQKSVAIFSPKHTAALYPEAACGESCNHSRVDFASPDPEQFPWYEEAKAQELHAQLQAGDALFIPEGWWHQVGSTEGTIAVNYWWRSGTVLALGGEVNCFFLREALAAAVGIEKDAMVRQVVPYSLRTKDCKRPRVPPDSHAWATSRCKTRHDSCSDDTGSPPAASRTTTDLSTSEDDTAGESSGRGDPDGASEDSRELELSHREETAMRLLALCVGVGECRERSQSPSSLPDEDTAAQILVAMQAAELRSVLLAMADRTPRILEALLLDYLSPLAVEIMTRHFEDMSSNDDPSDDPGSHGEFFQRIYSVCTDQAQLMQALIERKETFSAQACQRVLSHQLGLPSARVLPS